MDLSSTTELLNMPSMIPDLPSSMPTISGFAMSGDVLAILLVLGLLVLYTAWRGRGALVALVVSLYIALALFQNLPIEVTGGVNLLQTFLINAGILFVTAIVAHLFVYQLVSLDDWSEGLWKFFVPSVLAITATGLIFAILINTLEIGRVYEFSFYIAKAFAPDLYFWWLLAPVVGLFIASRG